MSSNTALCGRCAQGKKQQPTHVHLSARGGRVCTVQPPDAARAGAVANARGSLRRCASSCTGRNSAAGCVSSECGAASSGAPRRSSSFRRRLRAARARGQACWLALQRAARGEVGTSLTGVCQARMRSRLPPGCGSCPCGCPQTDVRGRLPAHRPRVPAGTGGGPGPPGPRAGEATRTSPARPPRRPAPGWPETVPRRGQGVRAQVRRARLCAGGAGAAAPWRARRAPESRAAGPPPGTSRGQKPSGWGPVRGVRTAAQWAREPPACRPGSRRSGSRTHHRRSTTPISSACSPWLDD